jgi:DNA-binding transcriptional regulator YiaG
MAYKIPSDCVACDHCRPQCPAGAIDIEDGQYWIDPTICDACKQYAEPQCVIHCPLSLPTPAQAKRGRAKTGFGVPTSPDLFANGKNHPFASAILIWEACNLLAQRHSLSWNQDTQNQLFYQRTLGQNGKLTLYLTEPEQQSPATHLVAISAIEAFDIRAACMHLIYAAHATRLDQPWQQEFVISDRQIELYLGLDKRKDLTKPAKLALIKELAQQPCSIHASMVSPPQGRIPGFAFNHQPIWHLLQIQHYFQEDEAGCKHLVGLTFTIRAGIWTQHFLNRQGCKDRVALYQYSTLPKSLLTTVMSIWQQHEGAARMMLWLLFKVRLGKEQRITVPTLMRIAYGERKLAHVATHREDRKRLLRAFESDLEVLNHYGLKPVFDPETYPAEIQPFWAKLAEIPDDAEAALEFWTRDGGQKNRLTDASPRGKWNLLINARILRFELPIEWQKAAGEGSKKQSTQTKRKTVSQRHRTQKESRYQNHSVTFSASVTAEQIAMARKQLGISQRELAEKIGKSQSWIRDIENGRFNIKSEDQAILRSLLKLK